MIKVLVIIRRIDGSYFRWVVRRIDTKRMRGICFQLFAQLQINFLYLELRDCPIFVQPTLTPVAFSRHTLAINMSRSYALWCDHLVLLYFFVRSIIAEMKETRRPNNIGANTVSSSVTTKYTDRIKENTREPIMLIFFISEHPFW